MHEYGMFRICTKAWEYSILLQCNCPNLQSKFYSEKIASVGLRNMLIVDRRKQWLAALYNV